MGLWRWWLSRRVRRIQAKRWDWVADKVEPGERLIEHVGAKLHWSDGLNAGVAYVSDRAFIFHDVNERTTVRLGLNEIQRLEGLGGDPPQFGLAWQVVDRPEVTAAGREGAVIVELYPSPAAVRLWESLKAEAMRVHPEWETADSPPADSE